MNATTLFAAPNAFSVPSPTAATAVSGTPRALLRVEGGVELVAALVAYAALGGSWLVFGLLFLTPDLAMLGYLAGSKVGAACYNAAHSYVGPALLAALGALFGGHVALTIACIWAAHVGFDRLLGYGLKYGTRFGDTHLGILPSRAADARAT